MTVNSFPLTYRSGENLQENKTVLILDYIFSSQILSSQADLFQSSKSSVVAVISWASSRHCSTRVRALVGKAGSSLGCALPPSTC